MSGVKRELEEIQMKQRNQDKILIDKGVRRECPCGNVFEPEDSSQYLCNYCQNKFDKA